MAKFRIEFTPYTRRDPVTGTPGSYMRNSRSYQTSKRLKEFQGCVRNAMTGVEAPEGTHKERAQFIRKQFTDAAKGCKKKE